MLFSNILRHNTPQIFKVVTHNAKFKAKDGSVYVDGAYIRWIIERKKPASGISFKRHIISEPEKADIRYLKQELAGAFTLREAHAFISHINCVYGTGTTKMIPLELPVNEYDPILSDFKENVFIETFKLDKKRLFVWGMFKLPNLAGVPYIYQN